MIPRTFSPPGILVAGILSLGACAAGVPTIPSAPVPIEVAVEPEDLGEGPEIDETEITVVELGLLGGVDYDLPVEANSWVEAELEYLVGERAAVIGRWMERGDFYEPFVKSVLEQHELPTDLYHLAMIESGFVPTARSRAGAVGLWQFMPATARLEGLRVDREVDERLDPIRSTYAAARHLQRLHRSFRGDWALAAAAYNAGSGRISRGLQGFAADNFWELALRGDLADETKHYVPRLFAMTIIARDRPRFGFGLAAPDQSSFAFDSVAVDLATPLAELAGMGDASLDELAMLNPHLLQRSTPDGDYHVWVPSGLGSSIQHAFLNSAYRRSGGFGTYVVRSGDTLGKIAQLSGIPSARIRELNPRTDWNRLPIGHRVRLPAGGAQALAARAASAPSSAAARGSANGASTGTGSSTTPSTALVGASHTHSISDGETLWGIARRYGVSVGQLQAENQLKNSTIRPGRTLTIPAASLGRQEAATATERVTVTEHVVKPGETLWSIARGYSSTVTAIQNLNRIDHSTIRPGQKLLIP